jgi:hypothetical protein
MKVMCKSDDKNAIKKCGMYKLKFGSWSGVHLAQTGRNFKTRFKEHISDIMHNREKNGYSQRILTTEHERAKDINSLEVMEVQPKSQYLNTLEKYHIYKHRRISVTFNELQYDMYNPIFELI